MAKLIAMVIRNAMEDFHVKHLSDAQMNELNPIIRNAVFTALHAMRHMISSNEAREFVEFQYRLIPKYWEEPEFLDDYTDVVGMMEKQESACVARLSRPSHGALSQSEELDKTARPSGEGAQKLRKRDLRVGGRYLHRNGFFIREIVIIDGDTVYWRDRVAGGACSKTTFLRQCPSIAQE